VVEPVEALNCTPTGQVHASPGVATVRGRNAAAADSIHASRTAASLADPRDLSPVIARRLGVALSAPAARFRPAGILAREGCRIEKIVIEPEPGIVLPTVVFSPAGGSGRRAAVVAVSEWGKAGGAAPGGDFERLARAGYVVVAPDLRGLGESRTRRPTVVYSELYDPDMRAIVVGKSMAGMQVGDLLQAVAYALARPDVDGSRVTVLGSGTAGVIGLLAAALERRIRRVVVDRAILSYGDIVHARLHAGIMDLVVPGILLDFDLPDVAQCAGTSRVVIVNPRMPDGSPATAGHAAATFGPGVEIRVGPGAEFEEIFD
jgi:dienelactone hydrolase